MSEMPEKNPHLGSTLESMLREDGIYEDAKNDAVKFRLPDLMR